MLFVVFISLMITFPEKTRLYAVNEGMSWAGWALDVNKVSTEHCLWEIENRAMSMTYIYTIHKVGLNIADYEPHHTTECNYMTLGQSYHLCAIQVRVIHAPPTYPMVHTVYPVIKVEYSAWWLSKSPSSNLAYSPVVPHKLWWCFNAMSQPILWEAICDEQVIIISSEQLQSFMTVQEECSAVMLLLHVWLQLGCRAVLNY